MKEDEILSLINKIFSINLTPTTNYHRLDGIDHSNKVVCEIKSRNCFHNTYPTTMIGLDKISFRNITFPDYKFLLVFEFQDGIYHYFYDERDDHKIKVGGRNDRGKKEEKLYCFISKKYLEKLYPESKYELFSKEEQTEHLPNSRPESVGLLQESSSSILDSRRIRSV